MIAHLTGTVFYKGANYLILQNNGIGYKVFAMPETVGAAQSGAEVSLWTHQITREDKTELYGFQTKPELDFFGMLIEVSGIGPKSALAILSLASVETLSRAIAAGDTTYLTKVSGIGKKTAGKIVLELKEKLAEGADEAFGAQSASESEALEALAALGYPLRDAREALKKTNKDIEGTNERIKEALKILSR